MLIFWCWISFFFLIFTTIYIFVQTVSFPSLYLFPSFFFPLPIPIKFGINGFSDNIIIEWVILAVRCSTTTSPPLFPPLTGRTSHSNRIKTSCVIIRPASWPRWSSYQAFLRYRIWISTHFAWSRTIWWRYTTWWWRICGIFVRIASMRG